MMNEKSLEAAILNLHWMARRYADGRCSYAPGLLNDCVRDLVALGYQLKQPLYARDGMGRLYDGLSDADVQAAEEDMPNGYSLHLTETQERLEKEIAAATSKVRKDTIEECADLIETSPFINKSTAEIIAKSLRSLLEKKP